MTRADSSDYPKEVANETPVIRFINNPRYLLLSIVGVVFVLESIVLVLLMHLPPLHSHQEAILDAAIVSLIIYPALYLLVFKPIKFHISLRQEMENKKDALIIELKEALDEVKTLRGFLPICASCKKIRDDKGYWQQVESYISAHSEAVFSHGICPECAKRLYPEIFKE